MRKTTKYYVAVATCAYAQVASARKYLSVFGDTAYDCYGNDVSLESLYVNRLESFSILNEKQANMMKYTTAEEREEYVKAIFFIFTGINDIFESAKNSVKGIEETENFVAANIKEWIEEEVWNY